MDRPSFYLLDSFSLIFQVFHAIPEMTGPSGQPTNAVFGIFRDVLNLLKNQKPDAIVAAFDGGGPVFRSELYADYKAQRGEMPADLVPQIDVIREVFEGFHIPVIVSPGAEADDVIATLAEQAVDRGYDVTICTSDKDARQLLGPHVRIFNLRKQQALDVEGLKADWGVSPEQVVDLLSLTGDTVDNVPGVPGIGIKTAAQLLQEFGTLDALLANVDKVSGAKRKENLKAHADTARRARELVRLKKDLEIELSWDVWRRHEPDVERLKKLCLSCGFHRFLDEIGAGQPTLPMLDGWRVEDYELVDTPEALGALVDRLGKLQRFSLDTETTSVDPLNAKLVGVSVAWDEGQAAYIPVRGPHGARVLDEATVIEALRPLLSEPERELVGQNLKYDLLVLGKRGVELGGKIVDTMVLSYLLESGERNHNLDELSKRLLDHSMIPITDLIGKGKNQATMDSVDVRRVADYAGEDADAALRLHTILRQRVEQEGLWTLYDGLERPLIKILAGMEAAGIAVDVERLKVLSVEFGHRLEGLVDQIYKEAGKPFNIGSGPQLRSILFEELKLPVVQRTPGGEPSTAVEVLEELSSKHPLPRLIIQHRQLEKLKGTYLDALPGMVHADGRIHASFHQTVAATGRLSSSDPNLQNIPVRSEDGRQIRQAFVAGRPGWSLLTADYSQVELRILAHYSEDPVLLEAFRNDHDIHAVVASQIFGVPESDVNDDQRRVAKTVNFGVIYGLSAFGLASRLSMSQSDAALFIEAYFKQYAGVDAFITRTLESARDAGRVETILGRRRPIQGIKNVTGRSRNLAERTAVNTVIQGSAADLIKRAMIDLDTLLREKGMQSRVLLQIHDELVLEAPNEELKDLARLVDSAMTGALDLRVPLKVELAAGPNWLDGTPIETS